MDINNSHQTSYELHEQSYAKTDIAKDLEVYENWFDRGTTDVWRHLRMLENIDPLLNHYPGAQWITVGDGRYGTSSIYINRKKGNALATDIDITLLEVALQKKWIQSFKYANAEAMPFADNRFDFAFCKEAYHHFPRAYIGIYEMLRISKKAVILVEPCDWLPSPIPRRILQIIKHRCKKILNRSIPHPETGNYEETGNYVFTLSTREIQKIALGLHLSCVAYRKFHDVYVAGVEYEKAVPGAPLLSRIQKEIKKQKMLTSLGLTNSNRIAAVFFKETPDTVLLDNYKNAGFTIVHLPENPYLKK